ncbi:MAG TPA: response regulator [Cytophagaceae bacterium]|jgi:CheY-like chemotaxis protein
MTLKPKYSSVMLVDDSEMDNMLNKMILQTVKFSESIQVFKSSIDALAYLTKGIDTINIPELILLDINMPEMNGFEFMDEFQKLPPKISNYTKVYIISSSDDPIDITNAAKYKSIIKYLKKPLNRLELMEE